MCVCVCVCVCDEAIEGLVLQEGGFFFRAPL